MHSKHVPTRTGTVNAPEAQISPSESPIYLPSAMYLSHANWVSFSCYVDCPDDPARFSAELVSEQDCATANAYDKGLSSITNHWTTPGPETVVATPTIHVDVADSTSTGEPTKSLSGLEESASASPSEGAAAIKFAGSWLALVGVGVGILVWEARWCQWLFSLPWYYNTSALCG